MTLRSAYRRTDRSLLVNPPSLKTGWVKRFVVIIGTTRPVSASAALNRSMWRCRSAASAPKGTRSSSWNVTPAAPSSARRCTDSTGSSAGRLASPKGSRACHPTVQRPKVKLSAGVGVGTGTVTSGGDVRQYFVQDLNLPVRLGTLSTDRHRESVIVQRLDE